MWPVTVAFILMLCPQGADANDVVIMKDVRRNLETTVRFLSEEIGQRSYLDLGKLNRTADFIEDALRSYGCDTTRQSLSYRDNTYFNIAAEVRGTSGKDEIIVIGAHYDTVIGTPGADDNASGIAGLLELARLTCRSPLSRTVRFVAFTLEEPPVFMTSRMGSHVYARELKKQGTPVLGMISLEMLGYYSDKRGSQLFPLPFFGWFYPEEGNFIAFVGNISSRSFTEKVKEAFKAVSPFPVESLNGISLIPGVDFSDHRSFWQFGFPAFMVTDTAFFRNPHYHAPGDRASTLDYDRMTEVVVSLYSALARLD